MGRRPCGVAFFCTSICETRIAGDTAATGTRPDSAPQVPLNTASSSPPGDDATEGGERRADEVRAAHDFLRAVRMDAIHHRRRDVEGIRNHPAGEGEAALDAIEVETKGLALALHRFEQHRLELVLCMRLRHVHEQVRLPRHAWEARVLATMPVRRGKSLDGDSPHEEAGQDAVLDHRHAARLHALVVEAIRAHEVGAGDAGDGGVEGHREGLRQHRLAHHAAEGLAVAHALLAMPLHPMA